MREMHKWKDKVELSLDNRQIFFLFFGLSVVGCFVFALGVMVGRRVDFGSTGEVAALASDGLAILSEDQAGEPEDPELTFKQALAEPAHEDVPPTRDPSLPPTPEPSESDKPEPSAKKLVPHVAAIGAKPEAAPVPKKSKNPVAGAAKPAAAEPVLAKASAKPAALPPPPSSAAASGKFTLQMKAFSRAEEAEAFAAPLRANGHDVRVESHEVKGRIWHRVRMGEFSSWEDGIAAKDSFEKRERLIAYVVRI